MTFLSEASLEEIHREREQIRSEVVVKLRDMEWPEDLHRLVLLRDGWQAHMDEADRRISEAVNRLKFIGASWAEIGKVLGISKQAAQQRFG